jgi:hypothetical protein
MYFARHCGFDHTAALFSDLLPKASMVATASVAPLPELTAFQAARSDLSSDKERLGIGLIRQGEVRIRLVGPRRVCDPHRSGN